MTALPDIAELSARLTDRIGDLAREVIGSDPTSRSARQWRFGRMGSLAVEIGGAKRGSWFDHEAGCGGDALGLVAHMRRVPMRDAYAWALAWLGEPATPRHPTPPHRPVAVSPALSGGVAETDAGKAWSRDMARTIWREAQPAAGTLVETYLTSRGLKLEPDAPLRFHPHAWRNRESGPPGPAMVALMTAPDTGEGRGAHVTYLRPDGSGKAAGDKPKVMLGSVGVIRLVPDAEVTMGLGIAEGIETALSVMQGYDWRPVWAATSAGAIRGFPVLAGISALTIFGDADGAGKAAAEACAARWSLAGREARICTPPAGDFNDMAREWAA
jgi:hypothetical protein